MITWVLEEIVTRCSTGDEEQAGALPLAPPQTSLHLINPTTQHSIGKVKLLTSKAQLSTAAAVEGEFWEPPS